MLDHENGEEIGDLGRPFIKVPLAKWADTNLWRQASDRARASFQAKGAMLPIVFNAQDVLVQEYPTRNTIAFLFCRRVAGEMLYVPVVLRLPPETVVELRLAGRWPYHSGTVH